LLSRDIVVFGLVGVVVVGVWVSVSVSIVDWCVVFKQKTAYEIHR